MPPASFRNNRVVSDQIIDVGCTHRARIAQIVDLNRGCPFGKDLWATVMRESAQIHCDINFQFSAKLRYVTIRERSDVYEPIHCRHHPLAHLIIRLRAKGKCQEFKPAFVVAFKQPRYEVGNRVVAIVGRKVPDTNLVTS